MSPPGFNDSDSADDDALVREAGLLSSAKKLALYTSGIASQKYMTALTDQQEIMADIADIVMEAYALESALLRARKLGSSELANAMTQIYAARAFGVIEQAARRVIAAVADGDTLRIHLAILRRLVKHEPADTIQLGRTVAAQAIRAGKFTL